MMSTFAVSLAYFVAITLPGISAFDIERIEAPDVVRNATGPVILSCIYDLDEDDQGLVIKWYHNENELIYQWIPPMAPQDIGVIRGRAEYPDEFLQSPRTRSVIRLREVTTEMGGNFTCVVFTYTSEATKTKSMIVYVPETNSSISTPALNETHISVVCDVRGAWPLPVFDFMVEGVSVEGRRVWPTEDRDYETNGLRIRHEAIIQEPKAPALLECGITIPGTDYRRRENLVYYPREFLSELAAAFQKNYGSSSKLQKDSKRIAFILFSILFVYIHVSLGNFMIIW